MNHLNVYNVWMCECTAWIRESSNNKSSGYDFGIRFALKYTQNIKKPWNNRIWWYNSQNCKHKYKQNKKLNVKWSNVLHAREKKTKSWEAMKRATKKSATFRLAVKPSAPKMTNKNQRFVRFSVVVAICILMIHTCNFLCADKIVYWANIAVLYCNHFFCSDVKKLQFSYNHTTSKNLFSFCLPFVDVLHFIWTHSARERERGQWRRVRDECALPIFSFRTIFSMSFAI